MFTRVRVCLVFALMLSLTLAAGLCGGSAADFVMKVTDKNYLDTQGFSVFLYDSTYHPVFVDQKNAAMEMIEPGQESSRPSTHASAHRKEIHRLKQLLAEKTLEVDFFRGALQKIEARGQRSSGSGEMTSTTRSEK